MERIFTFVIADDEPAIISNLNASPIWDKLGIKVIGSASDGEQCLNRIMTLKPDFAVIDIRMPVLSGLEVIKKCSDAGIQTQIIIISGYNEFTYAKEAIKYGAKAYILKPIDQDELAEELRLLSSRLDSRNKAADPAKYASSFFRDLVEGRITDSSVIHRILPTLDVRLTDTQCHAMRMTFRSDMSNTHYASFENIIDQVFPDRRAKYVFLDRHNLVLITNVRSVTPIEEAERLISLLDEKGYPHSVIGIGDTVPGLYQIPYSVNRAIMAASCRIYDRKRRIFTYLDICTVAPPATLPYDERAVADAVTENDTEGIKELVREFLRKVLYVEMPSCNYLYSVTDSFVQKVLSALSPLLHKCPITFPFQSVVKAESLDEIEGILNDFFISVASYLSGIYGQERARLLLDKANGLYDGEDEIIKNAKIYIKENITNGIQISDIAGNANLSPSYFAIYFKSKTGETLRDYLLNEKMEWAGKKLAKDDYSVEEIASELGYSDYHAFSRAFKRIYGESPSAFRDRIRK